MEDLSFAPLLAQHEFAAPVTAAEPPAPAAWSSGAERDESDHAYFIRRMHAAAAMAGAAASSAARLVHFELAGRYSVAAASAAAAIELPSSTCGGRP